MESIESRIKVFRRHHLVYYLLLTGILFELLFYLWTIHVDFISEFGRNTFNSPTKTFLVSAFGGIQPEGIQPEGIQPFRKIQLGDKNIDRASDMWRTYDWWDLWNDDSNCTRHQVHLLKEGTEPEPGAFVSFPGSGNSWTRSLLMGITGIYVTSIYTAEEVFFRPEGKCS